MKKMKKILFAFISLLAIGCAEQKPTEPTNGFGPYQGQTVYFGNESSIDVFKAIDAAWASFDYNAMKNLIQDGGNFVFEDGYIATTGQEFVDKADAEYQESLEKGEDWGWNTDYAFSVYPKGSDDPKATNQEGEWVNAQFTGTDGTYIEWYHIVDGKLKNWYQTKGDYIMPK